MAKKADPLAHVPLVDAAPPGSLTILQASERWGYGPESRNAVRRLIAKRRVSAVRVQLAGQPRPVLFITQPDPPEMLRQRAKPEGVKLARRSSRKPRTE
jgi:hypothetical protein